MTNKDYSAAEVVKLFIGDLEFDAIRLIETGEYRMSQSQVLSAIGLHKNWFSRLRSDRPEMSKALTKLGFSGYTEKVKINKGNSRSAKTLSITDTCIFWEYQTFEQGNQKSRLLYRALAQDSLRDRFDQAFDKPRVTKEERRLLDLLILVNPEKRDIHFEKEWRDEAERVTKYSWNTMPMAKFIRKCIYEWRFPSELISRVSEVNPYVDSQRRQNKHYQHFEVNLDKSVLQQHIHDVLGVLKTSTSIASFWSNMRSRFGNCVQQDLFD
jgi:hypothetical protein